LRIIDSNQLISNIQGLIEAVDYAADNGADIISMSFYLEIGPPGFRSSIKNAILKGIPVIAASGNTFQSDGGGKAQLSIPASFEEVIAVGASNYNKERAGYSNYGTGLELVAPVGDENENNITHTIRSSILNNRFGYGYGTSYAAPQVAGVVSLLKTIRNNLTVEEIRYILHTTSIDIQDPKWDEFTGYGIINASAAVNLAKIFTTIPVYTTYSPWAFLTTISVMMPFLLIFLLATLKKIIYRNFRKDF
ncbi:S8 family peptidase, partial [Candidatus Hodarchaeum mangrovi]